MSKIRSLSVCGAAMFFSLLVSSAFGYEKEIEDLSAQMAEKIAGKGKKTVAVVDFTDLEGNVTQLDQFIAEEFSVALASAGKGFRVIDRTYLRSIIKENNLSKTGLLDPVTARKLGKIAGVDALVTGTLTPFGDNVRLTVKVLDSETADIIDSAKGNFAKTQAINELLGKSIEYVTVAANSTQTKNEKYEQAIFFDDFNVGPKPYWKPILGNWTMVNGRYTVENIKKEKLYLSAIKGKKWKNFTFNADISPGYISSSLYSASICPKILNDNEFICFSMDGMKNKFTKTYWYLSKSENNKEYISNVDVETADGQSIQVLIEANNGVYTAYINGSKVSQIYDTNYIDLGEAGLAQSYKTWGYDKIRITFDNVLIIPLYR